MVHTLETKQVLDLISACFEKNNAKMVESVCKILGTDSPESFGLIKEVIHHVHAIHTNITLEKITHNL